MECWKQLFFGDQRSVKEGKRIADRKWGKLAAYISRAITVSMRDYDSVKIKWRLDELTEKVKEFRD